MLLHKGDVDGLICGTWGGTSLCTCSTSTRSLATSRNQRRRCADLCACMNGLMLPNRQVFLVDTHVFYDPSAWLAKITVMATEEMLRFGIKHQGGIAIPLQLWQQQRAQRRQDAPNISPAAGAGTVAGGGR